MSERQRTIHEITCDLCGQDYGEDDDEETISFRVFGLSPAQTDRIDICKACLSKPITELVQAANSTNSPKRTAGGHGGLAG